MAREKNNLGPTGDAIRANVKRLREERRLTYRELSDRLTAAGRPIPTLGLSRIEKGERRVDADDLVALAVALRVPPSILLFGNDGTGDIEVTGAGKLPAAHVWAWADRKAWIVPDDPDRRARLDYHVSAIVGGVDKSDPLTPEHMRRLFSGREDDPE